MDTQGDTARILSVCRTYAPTESLLTMSKAKRTIVIVGGVAGGASAATRARRLNEQADIILLEKDEHVSFANCGLPYYIGDEITDRSKLLVATPAFLAKRFRIDVRTRHKAIRIDRERKTLEIFDYTADRTYEQSYDKLILSPGASPLIVPIDGVDAPNVFTLRNVADTDRIRNAVDSGKASRACVVGAGFIGLEMVEQLARRGLKVSLAELQPQVLPMFDAEMVQPIVDELRKHNVALFLGDGIGNIATGEEGMATGVTLGSGTTIEADLVLLGLGVRPNTALASEAHLEIGSSGGIATNDYMQTNDPDIYAVGDAAEYCFGPTQKRQRVALAGPANRSGRLAGQHAATDRSDPMAPVLGTAIVRVFDQTAAMTGLTIKAAQAAGVAAESATVVAAHHAGYYPGAVPVRLKLVFDPNNGNVLGAQAIGGEGIDKRIDVIATAMAFGATVRDLAGLDLAYAPPFSAAKDPVHLAAFVACNHLDDINKVVPADADLSNCQVLEVRTAPEVDRCKLACAEPCANIPLDELRERLGELDPKATTVVSCGVGLRAHNAARILRQSGFDRVEVLSGGLTVRNDAMAAKGQS